MVFHILTIFSHIFDSYFQESILVRAQKKGLIEIKIYNLRDFAKDKHRTVDDKPYGGGAGMIFKIEPIFEAIQKIKLKIIGNFLEKESGAFLQTHSQAELGNEEKIELRSEKSEIKNEKEKAEIRNKKKELGFKNEKNLINQNILKNLTKNNQEEWKKWNDWARKNKIWQVILFSAKGKTYEQAMTRQFSQWQNLILICPRYEGADERVKKYIADKEISIGDYILTGGELPAMIVLDSVSRLIPRVLGNQESLKFESFAQKNYLEYPQYTMPADFRGWEVPKILLSGHHLKIMNWREKQGRIRK